MVGKKMSQLQTSSSDLSRAQRAKRTIILVIKRTLTFLFSHVGLTSLVVGYVIFGGVIFMALEKPNEMEEKRRQTDVRKEAKRIHEEVAENITQVK